jgi:trigger factor
VSLFQAIDSEYRIVPEKRMSASTLTRIAPTQVELEIPISRDELAAAEERAFRKLAKNVKLPGFRAGKVPRRVFEQTYGSAAIANQAIEDVVPEAYAKAVKEHALEPVDRPKMEVVTEEDGKPARVKATVEVRPEIALGQYKELEVEVAPVEIGDEDVEKSLLALAKERATIVPVDRPAELGDVATLDYAGTIDGVAFEGGTSAGQTVELDEGRFIPGFASGIAGMRAGESKTVDAVFPENYPQKDLAGKAAQFAVTLHEVKALELPALDDEFAGSISEGKTLVELRADVRRRLEAVAESRRRRAIGNAVMEKLLEAHDFPLPETMVERETESMLGDVAAQAARAGVPFEDYLKDAGKTEDELKAALRDDARTRVKGSLLIETIAKIEHIAATPADVAEELAALSQQYGQPVDRIRKALGNNVLSLMDGIVRTKTLEFLIDHTKTTDKKATKAETS